MNKTAALTSAPEDAAAYQQAIAQCFAEIDQLRDQMARDQAEINRSRARTRIKHRKTRSFTPLAFLGAI